MDAAGFDDVKGALQAVEGNAHFAGENVHRPGRQHAQDGGGAGQPADHLVERAIATGGDDHRLAGGGKTLCQLVGLAGMPGGIERKAVGVLHEEAQHAAALLASGLGVENERVAARRRHAGIVRRCLPAPQPVSSCNLRPQRGVKDLNGIKQDLTYSLENNQKSIVASA